MPIGISPLVDYALKHLLGSEQHVHITIHFLNSILVGQPKIKSVRFLNPIRNKKTARGKVSILDILAIDELGRHLNIEVQTSIPAGMKQRLTYYACDSYSGQLKEGQNYAELRPSITICVLTGALFPTHPLLHLDFRMRQLPTGLTLNNDLQIHVLQLNHLQVTAETLYNASAMEQWAWFLRHVDQLSIEQVARLFVDQEFSEAAGVLQMISRTPEQLMEYKARLKYQRDEAARREAVENVRRETAEMLAAAAEMRAVAEACGEARGILRGQIVLLQELLKDRVWTDKDFEGCDTEQLQKIVDQLQQRLYATLRVTP